MVLSGLCVLRGEFSMLNCILQFLDKWYILSATLINEESNEKDRYYNIAACLPGIACGMRTRNKYDPD